MTQEAESLSRENQFGGALGKSNRTIAIDLFERAEAGDLLSARGPWFDPNVRGGPGISTELGVSFLDDISFTARVICNLGVEGLEECYLRLDGNSQSARIVAIYALQSAFQFEDTLLVQAPMVGLYDGEPRDLDPSEIQTLKERFQPKIAELRKRRRDQVGSRE